MPITADTTTGLSHTAATADGRPGASPRDKLNKVDFSWFIVRTLPHQEKKLAALLSRQRATTKNLLEIYCPTHTTVRTQGRDGTDGQIPLFAGYVFVYTTGQVIADLIARHYPEGTILYERRKDDGRKAKFFTVPEEQMRAFKDFNENYAEHVIVLERPYSDYAFNPKTGEPNETVRVTDGPLAGREGYLTRFRRDRRLVFNMKMPGSGRFLAVSIPNVWNLHVVRLHNAEGDRQTTETMKERVAGWDLFEFEMARLNEKGGRCMFMGSSEKVLALIVEKARTAYPNIEVVTYSPPYKPEFTDEDNRAIIKAINDADPDLLWIGMTAPKQEKWTYAHWDELNIRCHVGTVGAVFDFFAGTYRRAPRWWQEHSLEWLYRLIKEPRRMWRRYVIGNPLFLLNLRREKNA